MRLAPFYDVVSTLLYIPEDVPALALSFDWYSKAWWPRGRIEDFARDHGRLSAAETARLLEDCTAAISVGVELATKLGKQIPKFFELSTTLIKLWNNRVSTFSA